MKKKNYSVNPNQSSSESLLRDIRRNTKRFFTSEQKVLIVMEGIHYVHSIAELCRKYPCKKYNIKHNYGKPIHPQTKGKIERYHRSMKNIIKLNHYFCPSELENAIDGWVKYYNERRFHESLDNLTPKDVYLGQGEKIKKIREIIKQNSINKRFFNNTTMRYQSK